jgi:hypothetical protein
MGAQTCHTHTSSWSAASDSSQGNQVEQLQADELLRDCWDDVRHVDATRGLRVQTSARPDRCARRSAAPSDVYPRELSAQIESSFRRKGNPRRATCGCPGRPLSRGRAMCSHLNGSHSLRSAWPVQILSPGARWRMPRCIPLARSCIQLSAGAAFRSTNLKPAPGRGTQRLFTFAQCDQIFTEHGDAEFRSIAVVKGSERLL